MRLWELQLWEEYALDVADEGETVCYCEDDAWAYRIAEALQDSVPTGQVLRCRVTTFTALISQDVSKRFFPALAPPTPADA